MKETVTKTKKIESIWRNLYNKLINSQFGKKDYIVWGILATVSFFLFNQGDILITAAGSFGYLNGHILDFYKYNADTIGSAAYLPSTYIMFAIWNIPIRLFGIVTEPTFDVPTYVLFWYKLLPVGFYFASGYLIFKICKLNHIDDKKSKIAMFIFLSCPMAFYSQFMFGQYDIFTVFFMLLGYYYYLKNDNKRFVLFFSIAVTFKYFALLFFVPILLLKQKNIFKIIINIVGALFFAALETLIYIITPGFSSGVLSFGAVTYIFKAVIDTGFYKISLVVFVWVLICLYAYLKETDEIYAYSLYCLNFVVFAAFGLAFWHPQWLLLAIPFMTLATIINKRSDVLLFLDLCFMVIFSIYVVNRWPDALDQNLFNLGILKHLPKEPLGSKLNMRTIYIIKDIDLLASFMSACLCALAILKHPKYTWTNPKEIQVDKQTWYIRARYLLGTLFFIIPATVCFLLALKPPYLTYSSFAASPEYTISYDSGYADISQEFTAAHKKLNRIDIYVGNMPESIEGNLVLQVYDTKSNEVIWETDRSFAEIQSNAQNQFECSDVSIEPGEQYNIRIQLGSADGASIVPLCINQATGSAPYSYVNGMSLDNNICLRIWESN